MSSKLILAPVVQLELQHAFELLKRDLTLEVIQDWIEKLESGHPNVQYGHRREITMPNSDEALQFEVCIRPRLVNRG